MDTKEHEIREELNQTVSDSFQSASNVSPHRREIKPLDELKLKDGLKDDKDGLINDDQDINGNSCSSSSDEDFDKRMDNETCTNSDEYMSNVSEEECAVFMCNECGKKFNNAIGLKAHLAKKHNPRALNSCELCNTKYRGDFDEHLYTEHTSADGGYVCKKCGFICDDYEIIVKHSHVKDTINACKWCGKMYKSIENYKLHLIIHSNGGCKRMREKFNCETCGKNFFVTYLRKDMTLSNGKKPYYQWKCKECRCSSSSEKSEMSKSEQSYKCSECNRNFGRNVDLKRHMRCHKGESPFV